MTEQLKVSFVEYPKPVGYWRLGYGAHIHTQFPMYGRPTDEQIKNTEELLGWEWVEAQEKC
jgi:hypothetical protein